jgi:hypothetical protein
MMTAKIATREAETLGKDPAARREDMADMTAAVKGGAREKEAKEGVKARARVKAGVKAKVVATSTETMTASLRTREKRAERGGLSMAPPNIAAISLADHPTRVKGSQSSGRWCSVLLVVAACNTRNSIGQASAVTVLVAGLARLL